MEFLKLESYKMSHLKLSIQGRLKQYQKVQKLPGLDPTGFNKSNAFLMEK